MSANPHSLTQPYVLIEVITDPAGTKLVVEMFRFAPAIWAALGGATANFHAIRRLDTQTSTAVFDLGGLLPADELALWTALARTFKSEVLVEGWDWRPTDSAKDRLSWTKALVAKSTAAIQAACNLLKLKDRDLFKHQVTGPTEWVTTFKTRGLLSWDPGTGKCTGAVACMEMAKAGRVVVVAPEHTFLAWRNETPKLTDRPVFFYGRDKNAGKAWALSPNGILVIGYASIVKDTMDKLGRQLPFDMLVVDECHYLKNEKAQRTKTIKKLANRVEKFLALSGTPAVAKPVELFPVLNMAHPATFPEFMPYALKFCGARKGKFGWEFNGAANLDELHALLSSTCMHRARKADCTDLPPKQRIVVPLEIDNREEYDRIAQGVLDVWTNLRGEELLVHPDAMVRFGQMRQAAVKGKLAASCGWLVNWLEANTEHKLVVFAYHKDVVNAILEALTQAGITASAIHSDVSQPHRDALITQFQGGSHLRVLVGTIGAMGTGNTMTAARYMAFVEVDLTPGNQLQAEDRIDRIGAVGNSTYYYLTAADTIDEVVVDKLHSKAKVVAQILDGGVASDDQSLLADVFQEIDKMADARKNIPAKPKKAQPLAPVVMGVDEGGQDSTTVVTVAHLPDGTMVVQDIVHVPDNTGSWEDLEALAEQRLTEIEQARDPVVIPKGVMPTAWDLSTAMIRETIDGSKPTHYDISGVPTLTVIQFGVLTAQHGVAQAAQMLGLKLRQPAHQMQQTSQGTPLIPDVLKQE